MLNNLNLNSKNTNSQFTKKFIVPARIVKTVGTVLNADMLLNHTQQQIGLNEEAHIKLINNANEKSGVLLDFGDEIHGGVKILTIYAQNDITQNVRLCFGESVAEALSHIGQKNATNDHSTRDFTVTLPSMSGLEFGQTGFRFLYLEYLTPNSEIALKSVNATLIFRDLEYKGSFECNDELLNKIFDVSAYTCHLNMQEMLWDGIKRDRLVWIGDMHPEMMTIKTIFGDDKCILEGLDFVRKQTQLPNYMNGILSYSLWWLIILADWYKYNGDTRYIIKEKNYISSLLNQLSTLIKENGEDVFGEWGYSGAFLDWSTLDMPTAVDGVRALFVIAMKAGVKLCQITADTQTQQVCKQTINKINRIKPSLDQAKQAAAIISLAEVLDAEEIANEVLIKDNSRGLSTFMSYYIFKAMAKGKKTAQAIAIMKEYYGGMLKMGATTFWEDFSVDWMKNACPIDRESKPGESDIHADNGAACYKGLRHSLCHGWSSGPVPFLTEEILGIKIMQAGCKEIEISPNLCGLNYAKGTFPTPKGILSVSHIVDENGQVITKYDAPNGIKVTLK